MLSTPGNGGLQAAMYCIYGRDCAKMVAVESRWEEYSLSGFVTRPTDARPSRSMQTFFVNDRPVKSRLLMSALEEAYRNQIMVGKFPGCVLHLTLPAHAVDVNVHPAKTEVKFLNEKAVFDCIHYGVLGALNKTPDRPQMHFRQEAPAPKQAVPASKTEIAAASAAPAKKDFYRTMSAEEYKAFSSALKEAPQPSPAAAAATLQKMERSPSLPLREPVTIPRPAAAAPIPSPKPSEKNIPEKQVPPETPEEPEQTALPMPEEIPWRLVGELYRSYILVEQGEDAFLIDKHAAHERILFEKLKANQEAISSQALLAPIPVNLNPTAAAELLANRQMLDEVGFEIEEFGENTVLLRQIPMDLSPDMAAEALETMADNLLSGRRERADSVRDEILHTVACKAAIKAGWNNDPQELLALAQQVMAREDLKYCPHGRPICISLSKKQLEKQFKRS